MLDALSQDLPSRTWMTNIDFSLAAAPATIKVAGQSYNNEDISDYVDKLTESIYFSEVKLEDVTAMKLESKIDVKGFHIVALPKGEFGAPKRNAAQAGTPGSPVSPVSNSATTPPVGAPK